MKYKHVIAGAFIDRPNRFIAHADLSGRVETVHVKNTGRCRELLLPGAEVWLSRSDSCSAERWSPPTRRAVSIMLMVKALQP